MGWMHASWACADLCSDILHPNRANISKTELSEKLAGLYKASKEQVSVFGLRTQFGGGKTTGFALIYDSPEAMKKFEPLYRLVRVGLGKKPERASRQQRTCFVSVARPPLTPPQASSARTDRRPSAARRRSRVPSPRRRNKRLASSECVILWARCWGRADALGQGPWLRLLCIALHQMPLRGLRQGNVSTWYSSRRRDGWV